MMADVDMRHVVEKGFLQKLSESQLGSMRMIMDSLRMYVDKDVLQCFLTLRANVYCLYPHDMA
jgi:hypothetical protein